MSETTALAADNETASALDPRSAIPAAQGFSLSSTLALLLAACGGGGDSIPGGLRDVSSAPYRPDLLPHDKREHLQPYHLAALGERKQAQAARTPTTDEFLDWAERSFPAFFPSKELSQFASGLVFRAYPGTSILLAVQQSTGDVFGSGPFSNDKPVKLGRLVDFADAVLTPTPASQPLTDEDAARFLLHAQFSASTEEIAAVRAKGYAAWLEEQLALPGSQTAWDWLTSKGYSRIDENEFYFSLAEGRYALWYQMLQSPDAVRRRFTLALSEIFVVSFEGLEGGPWPMFAGAAFWDLLAKHALGNFRDLIEGMTVNPAMGVYLNTRGNQKEDPNTGRLPDENYARELMQLFSIGLYELNLDGSHKFDASGKPIETYTQSDVSNLARVFTGYDLDRSSGTFAKVKPPVGPIPNLPTARSTMTLNAALHSTLEKKFLGVTIPAGTSGPESLRIALDTIFNHPNVGPFLARQFIQRLVTSNPGAGYVARVASTFNNNGAGVRGDLKATLRAVLLDPEARGAASLADPLFGKLREPMLRVAQWGRTFRVTSLRDTWKLSSSGKQAQADVMQMPLGAPSVFNFFRPGYVPPMTAFAARRATAPEFQIVNESTVSAWINWLQQWLPDGFYVATPELPNNAGPSPTDGHDIKPDYSAELSLFGNPRALINRLNLLLCAGQMSAATVQFIVDALTIDGPNQAMDAPTRKAHTVRGIFMVMCCAEYFAQR